MDKIIIANPSGHTRDFLKQRAQQGENVVEVAFGQLLDKMLNQWQLEKMALATTLKLPAHDFTRETQVLLNTFEWKLQWGRKELQKGVLS